MDKERPPLNAELKRQVRQKCGFACVICGCQVYDYDHIEEWSEVKEHTLDNLTLLCTLHHRQKTNGILSKEVVRERTNDIQHKANNGLPDINFFKCELVLGNNRINGMPSICFEVIGKDFFKISYDNELNQVVLNAKFYDNNGNVIFRIDDNVYQTSEDTWDVEIEGKSIIVREALRQKILEVILDGEKNEITIYGKIYFGPDRYLEISRKGILCHGYILMAHCVVEYCDTGIVVANEEYFQGKGGNAFGGRHFGGRFTYSPIGYARSLESLNGIYDRYPKGND